MDYKNANDVLPCDLLVSLQAYVDGAYIYVPRKPFHKKEWGEVSQGCLYRSTRNSKIYESYKTGESVAQLAKRFFLSPKTIYKIISNLNK